MNDKQTLRSISLWLFFSVCDLGTPSPFMRRSPFTSTWSTGTLFSTWAPFLRTDTSRSSWNKCLEVCLCEREKDGETITLLSFVSEKKTFSPEKLDWSICLFQRSMLVTSGLLGGLSNCLVVFPFHDRFWTLLLSFLQEACPRCCGLNGARWRRRPSSSTPDRSWRGSGTCTRTRSSTEISRYTEAHSQTSASFFFTSYSAICKIWPESEGSSRNIEGNQSIQQLLLLASCSLL